jgi:hypothetical protein
VGNNIDNESPVAIKGLFINNIDNDNDGNKYQKAKTVDLIADQLVERFKSPQSRAFYCKAAWKLSEATILNNVEQANKGKSPASLFNYLCKKAGV